MILLEFLLIGLAVGAANCQNNWRGNTETYRKEVLTTCRRCICRYSWGCSAWRSFRCCKWVTAYRCAPGWKHLGDNNCNVPICYPNCGNGGICVRPNQCQCPTTATGQFCQQLVCSYNRPCYPGNCYDNDKCNCTAGFVRQSPSSGCLKMTSLHKPFIGRSTTIISEILEADTKPKLLYYFLLDGTDEVSAAPVWSNQKRFNFVSYEFEASFNLLTDLTKRHTYVHDFQVGIVYGNVTLNVIKYDGSLKHNYTSTCMSTPRYSNPERGVFNCSISNQSFITLIEHADTLRVNFMAESGGFRQLINLDQGGSLLPLDTVTGVISTKEIEFKFDFLVPRHCMVDTSDTGICTGNEHVFAVENELTKTSITVTWNGWEDDPFGAGVWMYYLELHKLITKDLNLHLTEEDPIGPLATEEVMHVTKDKTMSATFNPVDPGVYSVLFEVRDLANNSRIARRTAIFDPSPKVTTKDGGPGLHVSSAIPESSYTWQTEVGDSVRIDVSWVDYFRNQVHEDGHFLNKIAAFPVQFNDLEQDGILSAKKFVDPSLDDHEGNRTLERIPNFHGIVKFEYAVQREYGGEEPSTWNIVSPLAESISLTENIKNGDTVKVWVRASDVMQMSLAEYTIVSFDNTSPIVTKEDSTLTELVLNTEDNPLGFTHSSRIDFDAFDYESGVRDIEIHILLQTVGKDDNEFRVHQNASIDETQTPPFDQSICYPTKDPSTCFLRQQKVYLDNCWFMVANKEDILRSAAKVTVTIFNQARLSETLTFTFNNLSKFDGLMASSGPTNFKIVNPTTTGLRLVWDLPEDVSCYGKADILLVVLAVGSDGKVEVITRTVSSSTKFFDVGGLNPNALYEFLVASKLSGGGTTEQLSLKARTAPETEPESQVGLIVGLAVGVLVIVAIVVVVLIVLVRRGVIHPQERVRRMRDTVVNKYRETVYGETTGRQFGHENVAYDNRPSSEELYLYGGMDINDAGFTVLDRSDIVLESLLKSGRFANIYLAKLRSDSSTVVAKTLKENFSKSDEYLMTAKINFLGTSVGDHPNVLKFIGTVTNNTAMGPMIIYEYCENGQLKEYLESHKTDVTIQMQDNLFRFGLDIAKGMSFLASKGIVHKRLAARNILLTFLNEVKITGFGPQPAEDDSGDVEQGKKERIPIKWMAPECMKSSKDATEQSDVWSYAVVLWEIFTLGETPYGNTKARDIPLRVKKGERLPKPEQCDDVWYGVMQRCWEFKPAARPTFEEIRGELNSMFVSSHDDEDYYYYKR